MECEHIYSISSRPFCYVKRSFLRHIRDPHNVQKFAHELMALL